VQRPAHLYAINADRGDSELFRIHHDAWDR
jgi:hypothetical protein